MTNNENGQKDLPKEIKSNNDKEISGAKKFDLPDSNKKNANQNISQNEQKENNEKLDNDNIEANKIEKRNEAINQFIKEMENKDKKNNENKENPKINKKEDEESDDPFSKAENEYRKKNAQKADNIEEKEKKEIVIKRQNKEVPENLRYKSEKDKIKNKSKNQKSKEKEKEKKWIQKLIYNHFKKGLNIKKINQDYNFKPRIFKNPENLYFKAIIDTEINKLKMKSYDRKTGIFNVKNFNKTKNNYINNNKIYNGYFNSTKTSFNYNNNSRDYLKTLNNNNFSKNNKNKKVDFLKKKNLFISTENNFNSINNKNSENTPEDNHLFYTSLSANNPKKTLLSSNLENKNIPRNKTKINKNKKLIINSANSKISTDKMRSYLLEYHKNKIKSRTNSLLSSNNRARSKTNSKNNIKKLLNSIDDPKNPYSINFSRNLLKKYYNLDIGFNKFELGVPLLNIKKSKHRFKSLNIFNDKINPKERMAKTSYNYFPSDIQVFNSNKNNSKANSRAKFSMTLSGFNFYKK